MSAARANRVRRRRPAAPGSFGGGGRPCWWLVTRDSCFVVRRSYELTTATSSHQSRFTSHQGHDRLRPLIPPYRAHRAERNNRLHIQRRFDGALLDALGAIGAREL